MENNVNLEGLSEEEASELCSKLLGACNQSITEIKKIINDNINYCHALDSFAKKYPHLFNNYLLSKN